MTRQISRVTIRKEWIEKGLSLEFPVDGVRYRIPHDTLLTIVSEVTPWLGSRSWKDDGWYSSAKPSKALVKRLQPFVLRRDSATQERRA